MYVFGGWVPQRQCDDSLLSKDTLPPPSQVQLIQATTNSFHLKWDELPTVEGYILQLNPESPASLVAGTPAPISEISSLNQGNSHSGVYSTTLPLFQTGLLGSGEGADCQVSPQQAVNCILSSGLQDDMCEQNSQVFCLIRSGRLQILPPNLLQERSVVQTENPSLSSRTELNGKQQTQFKPKSAVKTPLQYMPCIDSCTSQVKSTLPHPNNGDPDYTLLKKHDLLPGSVYRFRVAAINGCGVGPFSKVTEFKTCIPGYPGAPSSVKITKNVECIHISWDIPSSPTGNILEYSAYLAIRTSQLSETLNQLVFMKIYCGQRTSCIVTAAQLTNAHVDCSSRPAVVFRISAKNEKGYGPATQVRWLQDSSKNKKETKAAEKQCVPPSQSRENVMLKLESP
ncbi:host cell factor 2-like [Xenopus laevis]|uniref:Host cell factor 2-like n=1 Tax=Xenopus laevis TaxID=8355 RepID=A0A8J1MPN1_XENLA|nr:host cell factor 2-like [Xenopus laevis]